ncbi:MAG: hypothetical protein K8R88_00590 [Armatimonadetes bacterium]|nr:hypothetical protein [Armatimonadota bacterium]
MDNKVLDLASESAISLRTAHQGVVAWFWDETGCEGAVYIPTDSAKELQSVFESFLRGVEDEYQCKFENFEGVGQKTKFALARVGDHFELTLLVFGDDLKWQNTLVLNLGKRELLWLVESLGTDIAKL